MEIILDTADVEVIKYYNSIINVKGVTTNPSIIVKSGKDFQLVIKEILDILNEDQDLYIQVISSDVNSIVEEAKYISSIRNSKENIYVKIPVTVEGLKAIKEVKKLGIKVLATAINSLSQGYLAALSGADALAPYVNRICNYTDGIKVVSDLQNILNIHKFDTKIVAASFKNANQVNELLLAGINAVTVPPDILEKLVINQMTNDAVKIFEEDWEKAYNRKTLI